MTFLATPKQIVALRQDLDMTRSEFADAFGIPIMTLGHWESGRRIPTTTAIAYLRVIAFDPDLVRKALT